jgi:ATP-dependent DNA helicase RecQ
VEHGPVRSAGLRLGRVLTPGSGDAAALTPAQARVAGTLLEAIAGPDATLRSDQEVAVAALTRAGARVLLVQATGWGKSAVYWAATAIRRAEGFGPTLVVSPLLSLMRDQVAASTRAGLRAATVNSSNIDEWSHIESSLVDNRLDVLLVSPERLANPGFGRRVLDASAGRLGLLVIDEAHSVSDWGHDFRPDYRRVSDVLQRLNPDTPVLATTATANQRVTDDVARQLGRATLVLRGPLARSSLELAVIGPMSPLERFAWVVEQIASLPGSGIVYTLTVSDAERLTSVIQAVNGDAVAVASYSGQLDAAERELREEALRSNRVKALVATSALGMGYDKPDLGFVVHVGSPPSPVSYYQQIGRAGRAIDHALVVLLSSAADEGVWDYFATATIPDPEQVARLLSCLESADREQAWTVAALEAETGLRRGRVELMLKQLAVDGAVEREDSGWRRTAVGWTYDAEHYDSVVATRRREAEIMRRYLRGRTCLMQLLQESLDDPSAQPCGRCSVCRGALPPRLPDRPAPATVAAVTSLLRGETHLLNSRKMWPGGVFGSRGKIPATLLPEVGRTLIYADAPEWVEETASFTSTSEPSDALLAACVALMSRWRSEWVRRPDVVVDLSAMGFGTLVEAVADHLSSVGRLARATMTAPAPPPDARALGSAGEAVFWRDGLRLDDAGEAAVEGAVVLLVVDATSSLWPITLAAALLREAGAAAVLPLLLHQRP